MERVDSHSDVVLTAEPEKVQQNEMDLNRDRSPQNSNLSRHIHRV
jgi:hypothetical protein